MSTSTGKRRIDRILADGFLADLAGKPLAEVRQMRADASEEEALLSYERRLVHGRLAILRFELDRRSGKVEGSLSDPKNLAKVLSEEAMPPRGSFPGRDPDLEAFGSPTRRISKLLADDSLTNLSSMSDPDVAGRIAELEEVEQEASEVRARLLPILDALIEEIGRRYASGEADPSDVLRGE